MGEFSFIALLDAQSKKFLMPRAFPSMLYFHLGHPTTRSLSDALSLQPMFFALSDLKRWVVAAAGVSLLAGTPFSETDRARLILAVSRIQAAMTAAGVIRG
jgi:hypothetical protein